MPLAWTGLEHRMSKLPSIFQCHNTSVGALVHTEQAIPANGSWYQKTRGESSIPEVKLPLLEALQILCLTGVNHPSTNALEQVTQLDDRLPHTPVQHIPNCCRKHLLDHTMMIMAF
jgi:hypothetical protein